MGYSKYILLQRLGAILLTGCFILAVVGCSRSPKVLSQKDDTNDITGNFYLPAKANPGDPGLLFAELLYPLDDKPTPQCHASTIVETDRGLAVAFFAGTHEKHPDVGIWFSRMENNTWSRPIEVANGVMDEETRYPCWNPVLFQPSTGPLMLFYKVGPSPMEWWGMLMTSTDGGQTWSEPRKLGEDPTIGHLLGPIKNKPVELANGILISPSSTEEVGEETLWRVHFEISKDMGETWEVIGPINDGEEFDAIQPSILVHDPQRLQILCRTRENVIATSFSEDAGRTWSDLKGTELPNPNSGTDAVTLTDGRHLLVYNHSTKEGEEPKGRNLLNLAISADGEEWLPVMTLEDEPIRAGYAYPAIIQSRDGLVHITYTYNRESIKYMLVDPSVFD
ncbi:sialidase family protein [Pleomorphovibrio marinus]|uniref:sialidase family protein n=1 Tax=Pleomorphovibrio marinus TaxID=2164132 RepID=UPI001E3C1A7F|nr:sialidase family protein [Pleomorphovibrio marinus]